MCSSVGGEREARYLCSAPPDSTPIPLAAVVTRNNKKNMQRKTLFFFAAFLLKVQGLRILIAQDALSRLSGGRMLRLGACRLVAARTTPAQTVPQSRPKPRPSQRAARHLTTLQPSATMGDSGPSGAHLRSSDVVSSSCVVDTSLGRVRHWVGHRDVVSGLHLQEHFFEVPLDYENQGARKITVFCREVTSSRRDPSALPYLLYLQGGPGFESPRPFDSGGWVDKATESFRVLLLDQRGTGLSTPLTTASLRALGTAREQASHLALHRADNIVRDAECVRQCLGQAQWSTIGQSFGGFCTLTYLSLFPSSLRESFVFGGLPPVDAGCTAHRVYSYLFKRVRAQNEKFYARFPQDRERIARVFSHLLERRSVETPAGNILSAKSLQVSYPPAPATWQPETDPPTLTPLFLVPSASGSGLARRRGWSRFISCSSARSRSPPGSCPTSS